jgi:hypothetical protein
MPFPIGILSFRAHCNDGGTFMTAVKLRSVDIVPPDGEFCEPSATSLTRSALQVPGDDSRVAEHQLWGKPRTTPTTVLKAAHVSITLALGSSRTPNRPRTLTLGSQG